MTLKASAHWEGWINIGFCKVENGYFALIASFLKLIKKTITCGIMFFNFWFWNAWIWVFCFYISTDCGVIFRNKFFFKKLFVYKFVIKIIRFLILLGHGGLLVLLTCHVLTILTFFNQWNYFFMVYLIIISH